jgi:cell wall-associated NlpC family hydrolase
MTTMSWRMPARLIAAPLILTVLVTGQAAGSADASPATSSSSAPTLTSADEQQVLRELAQQHRRAVQALADRREREAKAAAERRQREAAAIGQRIVAAAAAQAGKPYVYGSTGPSSFDCSGLTGWAYAAVGIHLPRTSGAQASVMTRVSDPMPGDLVYMPGHIGIYAGNGQMWHAPRTGDVVKLATIWTGNVTYGRVR